MTLSAQRAVSIRLAVAAVDAADAQAHEAGAGVGVNVKIAGGIGLSIRKARKVILQMKVAIYVCTGA